MTVGIIQGAIHPQIPPAGMAGDSFTQNTNFVDSTYGNNGTAIPDDRDLQWVTIQAAIDASSVGDTIDIAPGVYAEALVIPHDLFFKGIGVTGLTAAPNISSGNIFGRIGKIEYYASGGNIFPDTALQDNWDCIQLLADVAVTATSTRYGIGLNPGTYGLLASDNDIDFATAGYDIIDIAGISTMPTIQSTPSANRVFRNVQASSFHNLRGVVSADNLSFIRGNATGTISGSWTKIDTNAQVIINTGSSGFTGMLNDIICSGGGISSSTSWSGQVKNVVSGTNEWFVGLIGANSVCDVISGDVNINDDYAGLIFIGNDTKYTVSSTVEAIGQGKIICQNGGGSATGANMQLVLDNPDTAQLLDSGSAVNLRDGSVITNPRLDIISDMPSIIRTGTRFDGGHIGDGTTQQTLGLQFKAEANHVTFESADDLLGFPVSPGARLNSCSFLGKTAAATDEFAPNLIGRSLVSDLGSNAEEMHWSDSEQVIAIPLNSQPFEEDPSSDEKRLIPDLSFFTMYVHRMPTAGTSTLQALVGKLFDFQLFQDSANIFGFGAGVWTYRTTPEEATRIDTLLGNPGADVNDTADTDDAVISEKVSIEVLNPVYTGVLCGPEVTITPLDFGNTHVEANSVAFDVPPQARIVIVDDDVILGSRGPLAALPSTGSTGGSRAAREGRDSRASIASGGSTPAVASSATVASLPEVASNGSAPSVAGIVSQASVSALASAGSTASASAVAGFAVAPITITLRENQQDLQSIQRIGTIAAYVDIVGPNGEPIQGKDRKVLRSQFEGHGVFSHEVDFGATKQYFLT